MSQDALVDKYCNAIKTYLSCGGHKKAARNRALADTYMEQAKKLGISLPAEDVAAKQGLFNGPGAN